MLKDDLERIIYKAIEKYLKEDPHWERYTVVIPNYRVERIAQAIVDRLEIDKDKLRRLIKRKLKSYKGEVMHNFLAKVIVKAKPIKLKEGDK